MTPTPDIIEEAAGLIRAGGIVAYPTETVYGLAADPFSDAAVRSLFDAKARPGDKPVLLVVADRAQLDDVAARVSGRAEACIRAFWPGPVSIVFPKSDRVSTLVTAGGDTVCVRCPGHAIARQLCAAVGHAITSSSANLSGEPAIRDLMDLNLRGVLLALDGGVLRVSLPSTIVDADTGTVLREGAVSKARIDTVLDGLS